MDIRTKFEINQAASDQNRSYKMSYLQMKHVKKFFSSFVQQLLNYFLKKFIVCYIEKQEH